MELREKTRISAPFLRDFYLDEDLFKPMKCMLLHLFKGKKKWLSMKIVCVAIADVRHNVAVSREIFSAQDTVGGQTQGLQMVLFYTLEPQINSVFPAGAPQSSWTRSGKVESRAVAPEAPRLHSHTQRVSIVAR